MTVIHPIFFIGLILVLLKNAADEEMGFESKCAEYTGVAVHRLNN